MVCVSGLHCCSLTFTLSPDRVPGWDGPVPAPGWHEQRQGYGRGGSTGMGHCSGELGRAAERGRSQSTCQRQGWGSPVLSVAGGLGGGALDVGLTSCWPLSESWSARCALLGC